MLSIVIPVYNEEKNIVPLIGRLRKALKNFRGYELLFIDDNSTDGSGQLLDEHAKKSPDVRVVHKTWNKGVGYAIKEGFRQAKGDIIVTMDGDLSHLPEDIPKLVNALGSADVALGSRFIEGGRLETDIMRKFITRSFNFLSGLLLGLSLHDMTTGFRAHKKKVLDSISLKSNDFELHIEIPIKAHKNGFKIVEVPIHYEKRRGGESKLKYTKVGKKYLRVIFENIL